MKKRQKQNLKKIIGSLIVIIIVLVIGYSKGETTEVLNDIKTSILGINETEKS